METTTSSLEGELAALGSPNGCYFVPHNKIMPLCKVCFNYVFFAPQLERCVFIASTEAADLYYFIGATLPKISFHTLHLSKFTKLTNKRETKLVYVIRF